jgi:tripartite-type tricarboxylate transporter receptor subunit TctC
MAALALIAAVVPWTTRAHAQHYPSRPITMVVPFGAGGPTDVIARILAQHMGASLGQTILVENVTGAAGTIGVGKAAHASPDGYTISIGHYGTHAVNSLIYSLDYDVVKDFEPVALLLSSPYLIVSKNAVPASNLKELVAWLKANPNEALTSFNGPGSAGQLLGLEFEKITGTSLRFVPYRRGDAPATLDMLAGRLTMKFAQPADSLAFIRAGQIKAYAVTGQSRLAAAPQIPTTDEAGMPDFNISVWHGLWVPKGTPASIVAKLNAAARSALADSTVRAKLASLGQEIVPAAHQTPQALAAQQQAEIARWRPIVEQEHIKAK